MAKRIYIDDDDIAEITAEIAATLKNTKCYGGIDIKRTIQKDDRFCIIHFSLLAWAKMTTLIARFGTEVQWHGLVRRISNFEFEIYNIIVPPHEVSAATVTSDYKEYNDWMNDLDDETFNKMRFHGHSHVNMGVTPSSTDSKYRKDIVTQLSRPADGEDVFYIFLIFNKKHEWSGEVYDLTHNALYETDDICINVDADEGTLEDFIVEAKSVAPERTTYTTVYYGGQASASQQTKKPKEKKARGGYSGYEEYYRSAGYYDDDDDPDSPFYRGYSK